MKIQPTDEPMIDGAFIESDLGISERSRCNYLTWGVLPPPDANLLGRHLWRVSTYRKFKGDLLAGRFAKVRAPRRAAAAAQGRV